MRNHNQTSAAAVARHESTVSTRKVQRCLKKSDESTVSTRVQRCLSNFETLGKFFCGAAELLVVDPREDMDEKSNMCLST